MSGPVAQDGQGRVRGRRPPGDEHGQRLGIVGQGAVGQPVGELGIVGPQRAAADHDGLDLRPHGMDPGPGDLAADPARIAGLGGDVAVQGHGQLDRDKRAVLGLPDHEIGNGVPALLFPDAHGHVDAALGQQGRPSAGLGIGIEAADDHPGQSRVKQGARAGRGLAEMVARLKRHVHGGAGRIESAFLGLAQAFHLGMGTAENLVPALGHNGPVLDQHRPDPGVGGGGALAARGQFQGPGHEYRVIRHSRPPRRRIRCRPRRSCRPRGHRDIPG